MHPTFFLPNKVISIADLTFYRLSHAGHKSVHLVTGTPKSSTEKRHHLFCKVLASVSNCKYLSMHGVLCLCENIKQMRNAKPSWKFVVVWLKLPSRPDRRPKRCAILASISLYIMYIWYILGLSLHSEKSAQQAVGNREEQ